MNKVSYCRSCDVYYPKFTDRCPNIDCGTELIKIDLNLAPFLLEHRETNRRLGIHVKYTFFSEESSLGGWWSVEDYVPHVYLGLTLDSVARFLDEIIPDIIKNLSFENVDIELFIPGESNDIPTFMEDAGIDIGILISGEHLDYLQFPDSEAEFNNYERNHVSQAYVLRALREVNRTIEDVVQKNLY